MSTYQFKKTAICGIVHAKFLLVWYSSKETSQNLLTTRKFTTRTHCLECRVQVEFKNFTVNTALHLSYDRYLCEEMLFQLKATFYKALYCINNLQSCPLVFLYMGACIVLSFVKIMQPCCSIKSASRAK